MKVPIEVAEVLAECKVQLYDDKNCLVLPDRQLDRELYEKVAKVIKAMTGKWNRKLKCFTFELDKDLKQTVEDAINFGETTDIKKEFQFFETPPDIAKKMIQMLECETTHEILEPSAGEGALIKAFPDPYKLIDAIEFNEMLIPNLETISRKTYHGDFLSMSSSLLRKYDRIIMNPPFAKNQDIIHIATALVDFLKPGGVLVTILSEGAFFRKDEKVKLFWELLNGEGYEHTTVDLERGAFKSSGTMVKARILKVWKKVETDIEVEEEEVSEPTVEPINTGEFECRSHARVGRVSVIPGQRVLVVDEEVDDFGCQLVTVEIQGERIQTSKNLFLQQFIFIV